MSLENCIKPNLEPSDPEYSSSSSRPILCTNLLRNFIILLW
jgi:hypothetical protein